MSEFQRTLDAALTASAKVASVLQALKTHGAEADQILASVGVSEALARASTMVTRLSDLADLARDGLAAKLAVGAGDPTDAEAG